MRASRGASEEEPQSTSQPTSMTCSKCRQRQAVMIDILHCQFCEEAMCRPCARFCCACHGVFCDLCSILK